jgi:hypothetical protein
MTLTPRLDLPDNPEFFAQTVVLNRRQAEQVLRAAEGRLQGLGRERAGAHVVDGPLPRADVDELALLRGIGKGGGGHRAHSLGRGGDEAFAGLGAAEGGGHAAAVTEPADVEEVADAVGLGALEDEVLQQAVQRVGDASGLALLRLAAERLRHGTGLVQQEDEGGGVDRLADGMTVRAVLPELEKNSASPL